MNKGALVGVGNVAINAHLPGWLGQPEVTLAAAADSRSGGREAFLAAFPGACWYSSALELFANEELDFVDICTPPASHASLIREALERGLHVLCEKPLVLSPAELRPLAALARRKDRALVTVHNWKHAPVLRKITELLEGGAVGELRRCRWETLRTRPAAGTGEQESWRTDPAQSGGGILVDHGWHALSVLRSWIPELPRSLCARLEYRGEARQSVEHTAAVTLDYDGFSVEIFLAWNASERANRVEIEGTEGTVRLDGGRLELLRGSPVRLAESWSLPSLTVGSHHPEWFPGVVEGFLREAADSSSRGRDLEEAAFCLTLLSLAQESGRRGGEVLAVEGPPSK